MKRSGDAGRRSCFTRPIVAAAHAPRRRGASRSAWIGGRTMNFRESAPVTRGDNAPPGRMTRRALLAGVAGAAALAAGVAPRSAFAQDWGMTGRGGGVMASGMARVAAAASSAEVDVRQRLAAAMGAGASAGTNQGVVIARGAAASAMASAQ